MRTSAVLSVVFSCVAMCPGRAIAQSAMADMPPICAQSYQQLRSPNPETARRANKIYDTCGEAFMICAMYTHNQGQSELRACIAKTVAGAVQSIDGKGQTKSRNPQTKVPPVPATKTGSDGASYFSRDMQEGSR